MTLTSRQLSEVVVVHITHCHGNYRKLKYVDGRTQKSVSYIQFKSKERQKIGRVYV